MTSARFCFGKIGAVFPCNEKEEESGLRIKGIVGRWRGKVAGVLNSGISFLAMRKRGRGVNQAFSGEWQGHQSLTG